jgi:arylsulfatase A-like enzyme
MHFGTDHGGPVHHIGRTHHESSPWYETPVRPPAGNPNVIFVVLDDVGYSDLGCFGSELRTPAFDALAASGLRYSNFHTTTLCSPTRACLLTGRNHHAVGMRYLANVDMGWPSGRGAITNRAATIAEMLRAHGYATLAVGKWHLAPTDEASAVGPFAQWPLGRGFDRFYGFMNGSTDQFYPELVEDNHLIAAPKLPQDGYHFSEDLIDRAIAMLSDRVSLAPDTPFFMHLCFGAGHFPHQAPVPYLERNRGRFDEGWDVVRERRLARQKVFGLVPEHVTLPPPNRGVAAWDDLPAQQRLVASRLQEAYAAFIEHTDDQFGRLTTFLERTGQRDNTLIVLISDNGASIDCGPEGTTNVLRWFNHLPESLEQNLADLDRIGGPDSFTNYPWGWAQASNSPLKLYKSYTHGGGVRDPLIVSWPRRIATRGGIRHQFHHVTDITPTVLELCGIEAPQTYLGVAQLPLHGTSFAYTFEQPSAPTRKTVQYFEMYGNRGIWHDGWKAVTDHTPGASFDDEHWELYHLDEDFAETNDLAAARPEKLREMIERWWAEAGKYDVMPLDDRREILFKPAPKPFSVRARQRFVYYPDLSTIPGEAAPLAQDVSHRIEIDLDRAGDANGALVVHGNRHGGYALFIHAGHLVYCYNYCGEITTLRSSSPVPSGASTIAFEFEKTAQLAGRVRLVIGGRAAGEQLLERTLLRTSLAPFTIGRASLPPVSELLDGAAVFGGTIERVIFELGGDRELVPDTLDVD